MFRPLLKLAGLATLIGVLASSSSAVIWNLSTTLSGAAEVPPNGSAGTGTFTATYNTDTNILDYVLNVSNLGTGATAAHIHGPAGPGVNAGVLVALSVVGGQTSFNTSGQVDASGVQGTFEPLLMNGQINAYVNVHTTGLPGGEIRGQLNAVPEPATFLLLAPALLAFRKRRVKN